MPPGAPIGPMGSSARRGATTSILDLDYSAKVNTCVHCYGSECDEHGGAVRYCIALPAMHDARLGWVGSTLALWVMLLRRGMHACMMGFASHFDLVLSTLLCIWSNAYRCLRLFPVLLSGAGLRPYGWNWPSKDPDSEVGSFPVDVCLVCMRGRGCVRSTERKPFDLFLIEVGPPLLEFNGI